MAWMGGRVGSVILTLINYKIIKLLGGLGYYGCGCMVWGCGRDVNVMSPSTHRVSTA